jgi:hypothetical protein
MTVLVKYTLHGERRTEEVGTDATDFASAAVDAVKQIKTRFTKARNVIVRSL